jgi:multiple sugar transport system permease protein
LAGIPAAYALARFTFPAKNGLAFVLMSFRFVPFIAFVIPLYLLYQRLGLYNTHAGLILAYQLITLPFTIWMLRSFFQEIPLEIQEAAKIDGCSWFGVLTRVILPLSMPGIAVSTGSPVLIIGAGATPAPRWPGAWPTPRCTSSASSRATG